MSTSPAPRLLTAALLCALGGVTLAQQSSSEPAPRSLLLDLNLPDAPRRITGGSTYAAETAHLVLNTGPHLSLCELAR